MQDSPPKSYKAIFIDLDGTLLREDLTISELDKQAVVQAHNDGIEVVLASGRPYEAIAKTAAQLSIGRYIIASNGGCVVDLKNEKVLYTSPIPKDVVSKAVKASYDTGATPTIYTAKEWFAEKIDKNVALEQKRANIDPRLTDFEAIAAPIIKILNIGDQLPLTELDNNLKATFHSQLEWFYTYPEYLEVMQKGASKGTARDFLIRHLGITLEETIAIGDGLNDCVLISGAGIGVAMSNGNESLKKVADVITLSNQEDGVATAIYGLIFKKTKFAEQLHYKQI